MVITLENIGNFTLQEVFDQCYSHLMLQQRKSLDSGGNCVYRHTDDDGTVTRCALGCFIPDSIYTEDFEETALYQVIEALEIDIYVITRQLLRDLQKVHDFKRPEQWSDALHAVADEYHLIFKGA